MAQPQNDGYRALAAAVLVRAIKDAHGQTDGALSIRQGVEFQQCARGFLRPNDEMLKVYCGLLDYNPVAVAEGAKQRGRSVVRQARRAMRGAGDG
jgi:stage V sporulation protein SpoVS